MKLTDEQTERGVMLYEEFCKKHNLDLEAEGELLGCLIQINIMRNVKQLLRDWENEVMELEAIKFVSVSELAAFISYAFKSLDESNFEILMDDLNGL